jgi:hypothetical protein
MRILDTLFTLFRRRKRFDDMSAEIRAHLDEKVDALMARGMSRSDAMLAARRAFGRVTQIEEAGRDVWRVPALDEILADLGFGLRFLRRSPTFAAVAVLSLAIGIGAQRGGVHSHQRVAAPEASSPGSVGTCRIRPTRRGNRRPDHAHLR